MAGRDLFADNPPQATPGGRDLFAEPSVSEGPMTWGQVGESAVKNVIPSAVQFAEDIVYPFLHPEQTARSMIELAAGVVEKISPLISEGRITGHNTAMADAVGQFFMDRYGSVENVKQTMATDPVGFLADVATVVQPAAGLASKIPGKTGRVAQVVAHPVRSAVGKVGQEVLGVTTGTGAAPYKYAGRAGREGGERAKAFRAGLSGSAEVAQETVEEARTAVQKIRQRASETYRQRMAKVGRNRQPLSWDGVDNALLEMEQVRRFRGISIDEATDITRRNIGREIEAWKALGPDYHDALGFDALKQKIWNEHVAKTKPGTAQRKVAMEAYNAIKREITKQAGDYADTMRAYSEAQELIREMDDTLSLKPGAKIDTSLRKLQSIMRNNAYTNYGRRLALGEILADSGADFLMERLSGQALEPIAPRGLARVFPGGIGIAAIPAVMADPMSALAYGAAATATSPRLMGEGAYLAGKAARTPAGTLPSVFQAGRLAEELERTKRRN